MVLYKTPRSTIIGLMRKQFSRGPIAKEARRRAKSTETGARGGVRQVCAACGESFKPIEIQIDHKNEVIPTDKVTDEFTLEEIYSRLNAKKHYTDTYVDFDNLQALCIPCHAKKTQAENKVRKITRQKYKEQKEKRMAMVQACDGCGAVIGTSIEGFGTKAGFGAIGVDLCTDCMARVENFFIDELKIGESVKIETEMTPPLGKQALDERTKRDEKVGTDETVN